MGFEAHESRKYHRRATVDLKPLGNLDFFIFMACFLGKTVTSIRQGIIKMLLFTSV